MAFVCAAHADGWPFKPIRVIVPFPPGGPTDIVGRALTARFQAQLGQPGVIENRPGANGALGAELAARAEPDGHTVLVASAGVLTINPALSTQLRYRLDQFAPITLAATTPNVLVTRADLPASSLRELVDLLGRAPGTLTYCSGGSGSSGHLTGELFGHVTRTAALHVAYRGATACQADLIAGRIDFSFQNLGAITTTIRAGRLKALVQTAPVRHTQLPEVPASPEAGFGDLLATSWQAAVAPSGTPDEVIARLHHAMVEALRSPKIGGQLARAGFDIVAGSPEELGALMRVETQRWAAVVQRTGLKAD